MPLFRRLLVAINGDQSPRDVLSRATRLAKEQGASIRLISVVEELPWYARLVFPAAEELQSLIVRNRTTALGRIAEDLGRDGVTASTCVRQGRRDIELVKEVVRGGHDMLMKVAEPNESVLFGSTDMRLLRSCPCPLWLFKPERAGADFVRILAAVDPAPPSDETDILHLKAEPGPKDEALDVEILELAGSLAGQEGGELHVVHAWSAPGEGLVRGDAVLAQEQVERYVNDCHDQARNAIDRLLAKLGERTGRCFVHLLKGSPADVIVEFAKKEQVDLIVLGTVARTGIPGLLIGNTAESVLQRVDCSVLAVKPTGFVSPVVADLDSSQAGPPAG